MLTEARRASVVATAAGLVVAPAASAAVALPAMRLPADCCTVRICCACAAGTGQAGAGRRHEQ